MLFEATEELDKNMSIFRRAGINRCVSDIQLHVSMIAPIPCENVTMLVIRLKVNKHC
jgi:hypothetical protein